ncbi:hypothetical protein QBC37DRAFT_375647 [Rhypophila decipiens]|uniref:Uncharacterized protein n=1 Tax=Rhypophila decipiens TaxID=261697 RepID=A0AAN6Y3G9_9PEZI|nr:hypothetical protein QBC37DRAFT_375647 [Rhypophila decipiens]
MDVPELGCGVTGPLDTPVPLAGSAEDVFVKGYGAEGVGVELPVPPGETILPVLYETGSPVPVDKLIGGETLGGEVPVGPGTALELLKGYGAEGPLVEDKGPVPVLRPLTPEILTGAVPDGAVGALEFVSGYGAEGLLVIAVGAVLGEEGKTTGAVDVLLLTLVGKKLAEADTAEDSDGDTEGGGPDVTDPVGIRDTVPFVTGNGAVEDLLEKDTGASEDVPLKGEFDVAVDATVPLDVDGRPELPEGLWVAELPSPELGPELAVLAGDVLLESGKGTEVGPAGPVVKRVGVVK